MSGPCSWSMAATSSGQVTHTGVTMGQVLLVHVFRYTSRRPIAPLLLSRDYLLLPPNVTNWRGWLEGYYVPLRPRAAECFPAYSFIEDRLGGTFCDLTRSTALAPSTTTISRQSPKANSTSERMDTDMPALAKTNMRVLLASRSKVHVGDIFVYQMPDDLFGYGRVVATDANVFAPGGILLYLYRYRSVAAEAPPRSELKVHTGSATSSSGIGTSVSD